ncbi:MAG: hypothetical protein A3H31_04265 [Gallionellales bacterium RIFCSPLOWO2_02_FULL_57_47]|nr:MAG: hypothetical protein A3H31_04265 [Gallionellales bacterium RIFCSPLOWO2_02_FULL_57_47]
MKVFMLDKLLRYLKSLRSMQRINMALARGGATGSLRIIDLSDPSTWEFSGFSQNGEDGIIDLLTRRIENPNRYFIEIGASDALENNTTWLAVARRFSGIWIEGDQETCDWCSYLFTSLNYGVECVCMFVTKEKVIDIKIRSLHENPDVFSLDIDGNDYHIADAVLSSGMRPKIFIVEYNSSFGPELSVSIPYRGNFRNSRAHGENLYYGCSITAWKKLFAKFGYVFVSVETNGVNGIFIDPKEFNGEFVRSIRGKHFAENFSQLREYRVNWEKQFELISSRELVTVN